MTYFVEIRATTRRTGPIRLVPLAEVDQHTGFRSVFCYSDEVADLIRESGSTRELQGVSVYSDTLFVDFDNQDPGPFRQALVERGVGFQAYDSGNRSCHFHIPVEPMEGPWVPLAQKQFMKGLAPEADLSFYHAAGQYRLPRTYHSKTGRPKTLIEQVEGKLLVIPKTEPREFRISLAGSDASEEYLHLLLTQRAAVGARSMHLFKIAITGAELGKTPEDVLDDLRYWNENFAERPHSDSVLMRNCVGAFERVSRRAT